MEALAIDENPRDLYRASDHELEIVFESRTLFLNTEEGTVLEEGQEPRPFVRIANWLHLNRGKKAWTYAADAYAILLLFLATSGMFMLPGKRGLRGRGAALVLLGIALPVIYVVASGGP